MALWSAFLPLVVPHVIGCPNPMAEQEVRRAAIDFFARTRAWMVWLDPIAGQALVRSYDFELPSQSQLSRLEKVRVAGSDLAIGSFKDAGPVASTLDNGQGTAFNNPLMTLQLTDFVAAGAVIDIQASLIPSRTSTGLDDSLFAQYADAIAEGAKARLMALPRQEWTDQNLAGLSRAMFDAAIDDCKVKAWRGSSSARGRTKATFF